ncbi:MAG TPA: hypothetical protein VGB34_07435 [Candidatus Limnocylindria bacterium]
MSDPRPPDDGPHWPERDLDRRDADDRSQPDDEGQLSEGQPTEGPPTEGPPTEGQPTEGPRTTEGEASIGFADAEGGWNPRVLGERRRPTTAEQAVPWLIGLLLALAGIVIVLLALIFTAPDGLVGDLGSPTPLASAATPAPSPSQPPAATTEPTATPVPTPVPTPTPVPVVYGPLEMVYLGRQSGFAPIYVLRRDFTTAAAPTVMASAAGGIEKFAWSPDGRVGVALIAGRAVALTPGQDGRPLAEGIQAITFGLDPETLYAVRVVRDGANDRAEIVRLNFADGAADTLATNTYPHPEVGAEEPLVEAQFIDNGGTVRIYATADGNLVVWILGAPSTYKVDVGNGAMTDVAAQPVLWSPDGQWRTALERSGGSTVIQLFNRSAELQASVTVTGLVSHIRWAGTSNEIVFTLGRAGTGGGVRQDLYVWDLVDGNAPAPLTNNGVSFGAEWLGIASRWVP